MEKDVRENEMTPVNSVDYVRGLKGKDSVLITLGNMASIIKETQGLTIEPNYEYDTGIDNYGIYQLDDYSSGGCAIFLVNYSKTLIIASMGTSFGTVIGEGCLSLYKKESNGNIFIRNNLSRQISIGFKRI